ncbi:MAG: hypothetical protein ACRD12_02580 [Acidimicrobiales bacterium]
MTPLTFDSSLRTAEDAAVTDRSPARLAPGLELLGEYQGSGSTEAQYLLRRRDGVVVAVSRLLYAVVAEVDGQRSLDAIAALVTSNAHRPVSAANVAYLVHQKLRPLGVLAGDADDGPRPTRPVLALAVRNAVVPDRLVRATSAHFRPLFLPPIVGAVLAAFVTMDAWLLFAHPEGPGLGDVIRRPALVLLVGVLTVVAAGFHELGHAAGAQYGGARPGVMGVGIYLIWPVFFSDLTDSYRLSRAGRLRADLGGVYFNVVFMLVVGAIYGLTGSGALLVVVALQHLAVLQQFLPFLRLDGYYIVSDLVGVPDLFARIKPVLSRLVPGRSGGAGGDLKPRVRAVVTVWVLVTVVLMAASLVLLTIRLPSIVTGTWQFAFDQALLVAALMRNGEVVGVVAGLRLLMLAVPLTGLTVALLRVVRGRRSPALKPRQAPGRA